MARWRTGLFAALLVCGAVSGGHASRPGLPSSEGAVAVSDASPSRPTRASQARRIVASGELPLVFERNDGQLDPAVRFLARGAGYQVFFTDDGATWALQTADPAAAEVVRMRLIGARAAAGVTGVAPQPARAHYFSGRRRAAWRTNVPTFGRVHHSQVYRGIDLHYYGREGALEYDFVVAPGVDPAVISLGFEGARRMTIDGAGDLVLETRGGRLVQRRPVAYQQVSGERRIVESRYVLAEGRTVGFAFGDYDRSLPLVIDPVIAYSTFLGGTGGAYGDQSYGVATDAADNIYITGKAGSTIFPAGGQPAGVAAFVVKMTPDGALAWVTVVNGNGSDSGEGIAVDSSGHVVVAGYTDSTNFPLVNPVHGDRGGRDAFALKLDPSGLIVYSTYLGGSSSFDYGEAAAVDPQGNAYVTGTTRSSNFPVLNAQKATIGGQDAFVVKLDPAGNQLYGTFLGGSGSEVGESITVDDTGSFYVTGWTSSSNFPRAQSTVSNGGGEDVFVTQYAPDGSSFVYSRFLGGNANERALAITLDGEGGVYVGGVTDSTNFPSALPIQGDQPGTDGFLTRLAVGGVVTFSTYLGGSDWERVLGLSVRNGLVFATGQTFSPDFPALNAVQPGKAGDATTADAFVTAVDVPLSTLAWSTYLGGAASEEGRGVAALPGGNVFVVGWTESSDFPTVRPIQEARSNVGNLFITRIAPLGVDAVSPAFVVMAGGDALTITGQDFLAGASVLVGGVAASNVAVLGGGTITATAPPLPAAGTVDVTVTNPDGGSGTLYRALVVLSGTGPVADAGADQSVEAAGPAGAQVVLDATASFDPDNEPMTFEWRDAGGNLVASGALASATLPIGVHTITLTVSDGHSAPGTDSVVVNVLDTTAPVITVVSPNGGNKIFTGTPTYIEWTASDGASGLSTFDVYLSTNGGSSFSATPICANVPATERSCTWASPGPGTSKARIRVTARDLAGNAASDISNSNFSIIAGTAFVKVTAPNTVVNWGAGSTQQIKWNHNLGAAAYTRLELSLDGGASWTLIEAAVKNTSSSSGVYNWTLPNALSSTARIRASWVHGPVADQSDANFTIAAPYIQLTGSAPGASWGYGTTRKQTWSTNLGPLDRVDVVLDVDGGATPPVSMALAVTATAKTATFDTPSLGSPATAARLQVVWANAPSGFSAAAVSAAFSVEPAYVTVTSPIGGETWLIGSKRNVTWVHNLGSLEKVTIELSQDDGASYPVVVLGSTPSDGSQAVNVQSAWATTLGRIRVAWLESPAAGDASDAAFVIR